MSESENSILCEKEMKVLSCEQGRSWSAEVWLLLAVISSGNGFLIAFSCFLECPRAWFATVICINVYRLVFNIKPTMPIILDLGVSLLLQWVICLGDLGWKWALSMAFVLNIEIFSICYFSSLLRKYMHQKRLQPASRPLVSLIYPLSPSLFMLAFFAIYILNGGLLMMTWFYPSNSKLYHVYHDLVGVILVLESLVFLSCYKCLNSGRNASTQGGGHTSRA
uniref:Transmembrane protein n=1 Tax=Davidia involucrata TaxID=16924 RepID=A0A5B7C393_DAVIN